MKARNKKGLSERGVRSISDRVMEKDMLGSHFFCMIGGDRGGCLGVQRVV